MKKLLILLFLVPVISIAQTKKPRHAVKRISKEVRYYYDSLGVKHNFDSSINIIIQQVIDTMKVRGYIKDK